MAKPLRTTINICGHEVPSVLYSLAFRLGQGTPEAVDIVMEQIGRSDLYWRWIDARRTADVLVARRPPVDDSSFFAMLEVKDPELEERIAEALTEQHHAWRDIQALIDMAKAHIEALPGYDGAPS